MLKNIPFGVGMGELNAKNTPSASLGTPEKWKKI